MSTKDRKELLETFQKLNPENQANLLAYVRVAYSAQETAVNRVKKAFPAKKRKSA